MVKPDVCGSWIIQTNHCSSCLRVKNLCHRYVAPFNVSSISLFICIDRPTAPGLGIALHSTVYPCRNTSETHFWCNKFPLAWNFSPIVAGLDVFQSSIRRRHMHVVCPCLVACISPMHLTAQLSATKFTILPPSSQVRSTCLKKNLFVCNQSWLSHYMAIQETAGCAGASFPSKFTHNIYSCKTLFIAFGKITFMLSIPSAKNFNRITITLPLRLKKCTFEWHIKDVCFCLPHYKQLESIEGRMCKNACFAKKALQKRKGLLSRESESSIVWWRPDFAWAVVAKKERSRGESACFCKRHILF